MWCTRLREFLHQCLLSSNKRPKDRFGDSLHRNHSPHGLGLPPVTNASLFVWCLIFHPVLLICGNWSQPHRRHRCVEPVSPLSRRILTFISRNLPFRVRHPALMSFPTTGVYIGCSLTREVVKPGPNLNVNFKVGDKVSTTVVGSESHFCTFASPSTYRTLAF